MANTKKWAGVATASALGVGVVSAASAVTLAQTVPLETTPSESEQSSVALANPNALSDFIEAASPVQAEPAEVLVPENNTFTPDITASPQVADPAVVTPAPAEIVAVNVPVVVTPTPTVQTPTALTPTVPTPNSPLTPLTQPSPVSPLTQPSPASAPTPNTPGSPQTPTVPSVV